LGKPTYADGRIIDWKRIVFTLIGVFLFFAVYYSPAWPDAVDPQGEKIKLTHEGKAALGLFLLIATWWVFEVLPIGVTAIAVGVIQVLFCIREPEAAFKDFMDPSVWFIFGSIVIGMVFTKTGLTKRMAYKMLAIVGEKTSMIYLGCFVLTASLTLIMAHTAVAATVFPLLMSIYSLYDEDHKPTRFGKGLFIGMAFTAGAGSIITLLGAARGAVAIGLFKAETGVEITFFQLTYYMFPIGVAMVLLLWGFFMVFFKPERSNIPGLRDRAKILYRGLGPVSRKEWITLTIVGCVIGAMSLRSFFPSLGDPAVSPIILDKSAIILTGTVLFFILKILDVDDLESIPWNIILLFGGAMSIGYCLYHTGAAKWLAIQWLIMFKTAPPLVFVMGISFFVLIMTNLIMNVAAISIVLPVALIMADYLGVSPYIILFCSLTAAGMPFLFLVGAAPNAIAYGSKQFTSGEFFKAGIPASILLMIILAFFVKWIWPAMGMP
jgi:sodium-dependent dicarboxylate transporter 2/3/5